MSKIIRDSSCVPVHKIYFICMQVWQKVKGGIVGISQDYNAVEKWAMTAHLRVAVHANFKDICIKQETRKEKELSRKSVIDSEDRVLKIIAAIRQYKNPFGFSSARSLN